MAETRSMLDDLAILARGQDGACDESHDRRERDRLIAAVVARGQRRSLLAPVVDWWSLLATRDRRRSWAAGLALTAALIAAVLLSWPDAALEYQLRGASFAEGGYVRADGTATLSFSDGSEVTLDRGAVARVVEVDSHGARMVLESGHAALAITPAKRASWSVAAGPYLVVVTGTRFDVRWQPNEQTLQVALHEGSIRVRGPHIVDGITLRAGQTLSTRLSDERVEVGTAVASDAQQPAATAEPSTPANSDAATEATTAAPAAEPKHAAVSWSKRVAAGDFDIVLSEAQARGVDGVLQSAPLGELSALADAARYRGRTALARRALTAVRERFASSAAAHTAAFLLGRMSSGSSAIRWYDQYLAEAPSGTYASEALGRKMLLLRGQNHSAAQKVAAEYLTRFPKGGYANVARELLGR